MAQLIAGPDSALDLRQLDVGEYGEARVVSRSSTSFTLDLGDGYVDTLTTTGINYNSSGAPTSGTILGIAETVNGGGHFSLTDLNFSATQFFGFVQAGNTSGALDGLFAGDDVVTGSRFNDYLDAYGGNDVLSGGDGGDTLTGGSGNDHIYGQSANGGNDGGDLLLGGDGSDYLQGNAGTDVLDGGNGSDRIQGGADNDQIGGGAGNDTVNGNKGDDSIAGGADNDYLRGGQGNDVLNGNEGDDVVLGDLGSDTLTGGTGIDVLAGGDGADLFRFATAGEAAYAASGASAYVVDQVTDFAHGTDRIALGFAPAAVLTGAAQSAAAAVAAAQGLLDGHAGNSEVAAVQVGGDTYLFWSGGGAAVDSGIRLLGVEANSLGGGDFA